MTKQLDQRGLFNLGGVEFFEKNNKFESIRWLTFFIGSTRPT